MTSKAHFSIQTNCAGDVTKLAFLLFLFVRKKTGHKIKN